MSDASKYDTFLGHNHADIPQVRRAAVLLDPAMLLSGELSVAESGMVI